MAWRRGPYTLDVPVWTILSWNINHWKSWEDEGYLTALTKQLIVNGDGGDPFGLPTLGGGRDRQEGNEVCGPLV